MKKESVIGFFIFASFLYGINNILKFTLNAQETKNTQNNKKQDEKNSDIDILMEEIEKMDNMNVAGINDDNEIIDVLESSMMQTIENDIIMVEKMIEKKEYLIKLNSKLVEIKQRLTNLKSEIEIRE